MSINSFVNRMKAAAAPVVEVASSVIHFGDTPATESVETATMRRFETEPRDDALFKKTKNKITLHGKDIDENGTLLEHARDHAGGASTFTVKREDGSKALVKGRTGNIGGGRVRIMVDSIQAVDETAGAETAAPFDYAEVFNAFFDQNVDNETAQKAFSRAAKRFSNAAGSKTTIPILSVVGVLRDLNKGSLKVHRTATKTLDVLFKTNFKHGFAVLEQERANARTKADVALLMFGFYDQNAHEVSADLLTKLFPKGFKGYTVDPAIETVTY